MPTEIFHLRVLGERAEELLEAAGEYGRFAEAVPDDLHRRGGAPLPCLMTFVQGKITHAGTLQPGNKAAEGSRRVNISEIDELITHLRAVDLLELTEGPQKAVLREQLRRSGLIRGDAADALLSAIRAIDPALADRVARFQTDRERIALLPGNVRQALAWEKETTATALSLAGIDRKELLSWKMPHDDDGSFLDGLEQVRLREDAMIMHDMHVVPGFEYVRPVARSAAVFQSGDITLTLVLANHLALEEQLGADLLYFNETYRAFTLIQYKAMEARTGASAIFRLPNDQLAEEIRRMRMHLEALRQCEPNDHCDGFRLLENPFFLKLCPRLDFEPTDTGLVKGMYLPLDYWELIEADPRIAGPRGGRHVSFENVGRYLDNSSFIPLVANGWVGTNANQSAMLEPIVRALVQEGRSLAIAVARGGKKPPPAPGYTYDYGNASESEPEYVRIYRG